MSDNVVTVLQPIAIGQPVAYDQELDGIRPANTELYEPMLGIALRPLMVGQQLDKKALFEGAGPVSRKTESDKVVPPVEPGISRKELRAMIREIVVEELEKAFRGPDWFPPVSTLFKEESTETPAETEESPKEQ